MASYSAQYYASAVPIPSKDSTYEYPSYAAYGDSSSSYYNDAIPSHTTSSSNYHHHHAHHPSSSSYSVSPPDHLDQSVVSSASGPTYSNAGLTTGYADDYCDSSAASSAAGVDFNEYMQDRFAETFDPLPLDRSLAVQAQTSGTLNAKHRELMDLQAKAQARLVKARGRFAEGLQDAQEVRSNLEWTSKKVSSMKKKAEKKHSKEYQKARQRYPSPEY
ncbi:Uu.00g070760.m01.CDS01 [Anthostomella pinea]|uniref:Biogenesis of lysosome-related organelles complex 1 subunit KXD1 n=1 Tax=Anthostomella pinea TaxID=933095 RepID=A0AAI8YNT7_9PEZI|nr:Uu.00g070760.m01.CDS01 [Anthostomella pinea]